MNVLDVGRGPAILLLSGTTTAVADWLSVIEWARPSYRVLAVEVPGYGGSAVGPPMTVAERGERIAGELVRLGAAALHAIVGISAGAYRAFDLILNRRVSAETIVAISGLASLDEAGRAGHRGLAAALRGDPDFARSDACRALLRDALLPPGHHHHEDAAMRWLASTDPLALACELEAMADSTDLRAELSRVRSRVHLRVGALDTACPVAWSEDIARGCGGATLEIVPRCGHALLVEDGEATSQFIARVLTQP